MVILCGLVILSFAFVSSGTNAEMAYAPRPPQYTGHVTAFDLASYVPTHFAYRRDARLSEPCFGASRYPLQSLSFEMTCDRWDELNGQPWGLGRMAIVDQPFRNAFVPTQMQ
jgi:hypothetical protein